MGDKIENRVGDWRQTFLGAMYWPCDPRADEVGIADIAHHLSTINRFGGAAREPYSVADHCVRVSRLVEERGRRDLALEALFHDAAEGMLGMDCIRPVKRSGLLGLMITDLENRNQKVIHQRFNLPDCFYVEEIVYEYTEDDAWYHFFDAKEWYNVKLSVMRHQMPPEIVAADDVLLMTEARDLMARPPMPWRESTNKPLLERIIPLTSSQAEYHFLARFQELTAIK